MEYDITRQNDSVTIIFKENELLDSFNEETYTELMLKTADENKNIVLDFTAVDIADSLFIGGLIMLEKKIEAQNKTLSLKGLNKHLKDLFQKLNLKGLES